MRMMIVGVGQTLNFESKEMEDVLHVQAEDGSMLVVPTTNEAAQELVKLAMNSNGHSEDPFIRAAEKQPQRMRVMSEPSPEEVEYPEGASVFGGGDEPTVDDMARFQQMMRETAPDTGDPSHGNPEGPSVVSDGPGMFEMVQETVVGRQKGVTAKMDDRSGVATRMLSTSLVDEKGNPRMAHAPDDSMEDEEDPGEQI